MKTAEENALFLELIRSIVTGDVGSVEQLIKGRPELPIMAMSVGSTREKSVDHFFPEIAHCLYGGDTALHIAAAACSSALVELLVSNGAAPRAKNRRGAEPLHYAADGNGAESPGQAAVIKFLISAGADPDAVDKSGVAPLHRAVRKRSSSAVLALLDGGASLDMRNGSGSTALHLAVQNTGASGSGTDRAREQQFEIIRLLLARGADPNLCDGKNKTA